MKRTVLVLGATSAIARSSAFAFAAQGYPLYLAGRDEDELERIAQDLRIRYQTDVKTGFFDADSFGGHRVFLEHVIQQAHGLEGVLLACGYLGDQAAAKIDFVEAERVISRNFTGACSILTHCADYLQKQGAGFIIGISSVAGDRGRQSNYVYGAAKAGFTTFLQGLRNRLFHSRVHVMTVKPGFVDTAMTFGVPGMFLVASPEYVGGKIVEGLMKRRNEIYVPWFWSLIMKIIKAVPEPIFKKLKL